MSGLFWRRSSTIVLGFVATMVGLGLTGCGLDARTGGERVQLRTVVAGDASTTFTNALGWTVSLSEARLSVGALYYFEGAPVMARRRQVRERSWSPWMSMGIRQAHAHPGHYVEGEAIGQVLLGGVADLRTTVELGPGDGVTGTAQSAHFSFGGELSDPDVRGAVVRVRGAASRADQLRRFDAAVTGAEIAGPSGELTVEGCPFHEGQVDGSGTVTMSVATREWLDQVDFTGPDGPLAASAKGALIRGLRKAVAYHFRFAR